jgi:chromosome segregation ATPase
LEKSNVCLRAEIEKIRNLHQGVSEQLEETSTELARMRIELSQAKVAKGDIEEKSHLLKEKEGGLRRENERMALGIQQLQFNLKSKEIALITVETLEGKFKGTASKNEELNRAVIALEEENRRVNGELDRSQKQINGMINLIETLEKEKSAFEDSLSHLKNELEKIRIRYESQVSESESLSERIMPLEIEIQKLDEQLEALQ